MFSEEEEYEIESILEARIAKKKRKSAWEFRVRWKGYSSDDDTWEPIEHLEGSEETLSRFVERIDTGGRDYRNLESFKAGETFVPVGPPKKLKGKGKEKPPSRNIEYVDEVVEATPEAEPSLLSRTRKRDSQDADAEIMHSSKRPRPTLQAFSSKPNLLLTDSPIKPTPLKNPGFDLPLGGETSSRGITTAEPGSMDDLLHFSDGATLERRAHENGTAKDSISTSSPTKVVKKMMPLHRARAANPLVKSLEDQNIQGFKSYGTNNLSGTKRSSPSKRKKPGPGRSSEGLLARGPTLLTVVKGKLQSVEGKKKAGDRSGDACDEGSNAKQQGDSLDVSEIVIDQDDSLDPSNPGELLQLAGLGPESENLPGYEEDNMSPESSGSQLAPQSSDHPLSSAVRDSLFPSTAPEVESNPAWTRPTIFGPLGLGVNTSVTTDSNTEVDESSTPFQINLDSMTSLPIIFIDHVSASPFPTSTLSKWGPPGKFYRGSSAVDILSTIRTKGSFARVRLLPEVSSPSITSWKHFVERLSTGDELFVAMAGQDLLAFCSSSNTFFTQRLNIPSNLLSPDAILVSHVSIENHSAFAEAAANADGTTWSQYVLTTAAAS